MTKSNIIYSLSIVSSLVFFYLGSNILDHYSGIINENKTIYDKINNIKDLQKSVSDMKSGEVSYALDNNSVFLQPYYTGKINYIATYDKLNKRNDFSEEEKAHLDAANRAFEEWGSKVKISVDKELLIQQKVISGDKDAINTSKKVIDEYTKSALERSILTDLFFTTTEQINIEEGEKLKILENNEEKVQTYTKLILFVGPLFSIFIIFFLNKNLETVTKEKEDLKNKIVEMEKKKIPVARGKKTPTPVTKKKTTVPRKKPLDKTE